MMTRERWNKVFVKAYDPLKAGSIDGTDTEAHDHGIIRALNAHYKPNKSVEGNPNSTLFVGRLNLITTEETLHKIFAEEGDIKNVKIVRDIVTGMSKGYSFIEFEEASAARRAYAHMNRIMVDDKWILVEFEQERCLDGWVPRRLGGGIGGKKESGQLRFGGREKPFHQPIFIPNDAKDCSSSATHLSPSRERNSASPDSRKAFHSRDRQRRQDWRHSGDHRNRGGRERDRDRSVDRYRDRSVERYRKHHRHDRRSRDRDRSRNRNDEKRYRDRSRDRERSRTRDVRRKEKSPKRPKREREQSSDRDRSVGNDKEDTKDRDAKKVKYIKTESGAETEIKWDI